MVATPAGFAGKSVMSIILFAWLVALVTFIAMVMVLDRRGGEGQEPN